MGSRASLDAVEKNVTPAGNWTPAVQPTGGEPYGCKLCREVHNWIKQSLRHTFTLKKLNECKFCYMNFCNVTGKLSLNLTTRIYKEFRRMFWYAIGMNRTCKILGSGVIPSRILMCPKVVTNGVIGGGGAYGSRFLAVDSEKFWPRFQITF
jgi:hypothetical protein